MTRYEPGDTEQYFADGELVVPDKDYRWIHATPGLRAAAWREARFGIQTNPAVYEAEYKKLIDDGFSLGPGPGHDGSWARGTWVNVTWDRRRGVWNR